MGIFSRVRDVVCANVQAMVEKAEDPEKLLALLARDIENALVEIKAQCASAMAQSKACGRMINEANAQAAAWAGKARAAVKKGREDLAREALIQKRLCRQRAESLEEQRRECQQLIEQYQDDIVQLEAKMRSVRERQRSLARRRMRACTRKRAEERLRHADSAGVAMRTEGLERRIDRMEADAEMARYGRKPSLEEEFDRLVGDEELEQELERIRAEVAGKS